MKVLHVAQALSRNFGGIQTVVQDLVKAQHSHGLTVDVVSTNVDAPRGVLPVVANQFIERDGIKIRYSSVEFRPLLYSRDLKDYLGKHIAQYDLIHIHGLYRFPPTYAAYQARHQNVPYVITPHGALDPYLYSKSSRSVWLKRLYERWFDLPNLHRADAIHYTAEEERERAEYLRIRAPSFVMPNGLDWAQYESLPPRGALRRRIGIGEAPLVLFLGRLHVKKGLDILVPAFAKLRKKIADAQLVIVGPENDDYAQKVRGWVREYGLDKAVFFTGSLHGTEVLQAYVDADVFALTSYTENFGMTVVEAMACKLPVVISDQVNIHAEVRAAGAGLITHCDVNEVAEALETLLSSREQRHALGGAGRQLAKERYTWPVIVEALTNEYRAIIQRRRRADSRQGKTQPSTTGP